MSAFAEQAADVAGQPREPGVGECAPARPRRPEQPVPPVFGDEPRPRLPGYQSGPVAHRDEGADRVEVGGHRVGEAFRVGQRDAALGEFPCRFALDLGEQFRDRGDGGEGAIGGEAVDETAVDIWHRFENTGCVRHREFVEAGQAERGPRPQLVAHALVGGVALRLGFEQEQAGHRGGPFRDGRRIVRLARDGVQPAYDVGRGWRSGLLGQLSDGGEHGQGLAIEPGERLLDRPAVEEGFGQVEEVLDAVRGVAVGRDTARADRVSERSIVHRPQAGGE